MYLPPYYFHQVEALDDAISINEWFLAEEVVRRAFGHLWKSNRRDGICCVANIHSKLTQPFLLIQVKMDSAWEEELPFSSGMSSDELVATVKLVILQFVDLVFSVRLEPFTVHLSLNPTYLLQCFVLHLCSALLWSGLVWLFSLSEAWKVFTAPIPLILCLDWFRNGLSLCMAHFPPMAARRVTLEWNRWIYWKEWWRRMIRTWEFTSGNKSVSTQPNSSPPINSD